MYKRQVDVYVTSSLAESFGQTIIEAQACGTIPVGFDLGGIPDIDVYKRQIIWSMR